MKWWRTASFYFRINVVIVSSVLLLSVALSGVVFVHNRMLLEKELDKRGAEIGNSIAAMGSESILLDERFVLHEIAAKARRGSDDIRYIIIADYAGEILAHTFGDGFPSGLPLELPRPDAGGEAAYAVTRHRSNEGPFREVVVPVERGAVGYVRVGLTEQDMRLILENNIKNFSLITLVVCLLAAVVATRLAYRIVHPIDQLAQAAGQIRQGNYGVRIAPDDQAEVGRLASAFNDMAAALTRKDDENEQLLTVLRDKDARHVRLLQKVLSVQEDERKRISRELHDEAGQSLASLLAYLQLLLAGEATPGQREAIGQLKGLVVEILGGLRKMAVELRPPALDDLGLVPAMAKYVDGFALQRDLTAIFAPEDDNPELDPAVALALYRILQESLTNVARHADARAVRVELAAVGGDVALTVSDDGRGFDAAALPVMLQGEGSLGISGMMERAELLGGTFEIKSCPGQGTTVRVALPRRLG
jgi:signal transduction histidine kinase